MVHFRMRQFLRDGDACHFAISDLRETGRPHTHDFHELFWVRGGEGAHLVNRERVGLAPGVLTLIHSSDQHTLEVPAGGSLRISNLAFPSAHWKRFWSHYHTGRADPFEASHSQRRHLLSGVEYAQLQQAADELAQGGRSLLALDRFLMNLVYLLLRQSVRQEQAQIPDWLAGAISAMSHAKQLKQGTAALVELSGRSPEHVCRSVRKHLGKTPTDLVNELRLALAAQLLGQSDQPIADIADECGLSNLSHFYRLFRAAYGQTPAQYRHSQQLIVNA